MTNVKEYINSGILEMYVLGNTSLEETNDVNEMAHLHEEIRVEIEEITNTLLAYSANTLKKPSDALRPFVLAVVDYTERLNSGEVPSEPPTLTLNSKVEDFKTWTDRPDMFLPEDSGDMYAKIIGFTPQATTAISWVKTISATEVHDHEHERFLILEGSCDVVIGNETHQLVAGDYLEIPLHVGHSLIVTSLIPCKFILQRIAA